MQPCAIVRQIYELLCEQPFFWVVCGELHMCGLYCTMHY